MTIEKIRIHVLILNVPQPLLRALRQSRTRSSRVRYSHRRRRRSSSCRHFLEQQQPQQKGFEGEKFVMLFLGKEYYFFSLLCLFLVNSSSSKRKRNRPAATARVLLSLSFFLSFIQTTLLYNKTDFTVIENYPYTERERERGKKAWLEVSCVCV
jgi:heme/copper-type cytochrome/quinol oxidase subunit 3